MIPDAAPRSCATPRSGCPLLPRLPHRSKAASRRRRCSISGHRRGGPPTNGGTEQSSPPTPPYGPGGACSVDSPSCLPSSGIVSHQVEDKWGLRWWRWDFFSLNFASGLLGCFLICTWTVGIGI
ncbi:hypothetical protein BRADI_5g22175v3 [Brachypodium distachyon]|uniref:Uncharacterized protein n=1 Tax=Brachypodium distachyon TaxID=15368 RepID=A0A2K2CIL9_BRADI|nr:hypothetical protein BRADI_5g22175v3 [Brachypodium distachyon]